MFVHATTMSIPSARKVLRLVRGFVDFQMPRKSLGKDLIDVHSFHRQPGLDGFGSFKMAKGEHGANPSLACLSES